LLNYLAELAVRLGAAVATVKPAMLKKVWTDLACDTICYGLLIVPTLRICKLLGVGHINLSVKYTKILFFNRCIVRPDINKLLHSPTDALFVNLRKLQNSH
jgi:hypothetical protein